MKTITKPVTDGVAATVCVWFFKLDMCGHKNRTYFVHLFCIRFICYRLIFMRTQNFLGTVYKASVGHLKC